MNRQQPFAIQPSPVTLNLNNAPTRTNTAWSSHSLSQHMLTIVPVLDLQQVADEAVGCHTLREATLCCLTLWCATYKLGKKVVAEGAARRQMALLGGVQGQGVGHELNQRSPVDGG